MNVRKYKLRDIADYLYETYELVWENYKICEDGVFRRVRETDFCLGDQLSVITVMRKGLHVRSRILHVSNDSLHVSGYPKEVEDWQDFLAHRHNTEQEINNSQ